LDIGYIGRKYQDWYLQMVAIQSCAQTLFCPDPLAREKRVWCSGQHFLSHGVGPISDLRSQIRLQKT